MKKVLMLLLPVLAVLGLTLFISRAGAEQIGEVSTVFKLLSPNDKIVVDAYEDRRWRA